MNRIVCNWTITSFKIQHSPDFRKQRYGERTIWFDPYCPFKQFSTVFFKGWNSWIQLLFYFFLEHHKETLKKEQYNLIHVIKSTHGLAWIAFSNICSRLWSGDNTVWRILSIKEIFQGFIQAYNLLLLQRFKKNSIMDNTVWPISSFQKMIELHCTSQNFYQTIRLESYSPLKYFRQVSTKSSILFSIFMKSCIFFLYLHYFK